MHLYSFRDVKRICYTNQNIIFHLFNHNKMRVGRRMLKWNLGINRVFRRLTTFDSIPVLINSFKFLSPTWNTLRKFPTATACSQTEEKY